MGPGRRTAVAILLGALLVSGCAPRSARPINVLTDLPPDAELMAEPFAPGRILLSGFDAPDPEGVWRIGDRVLFGLQIDKGWTSVVRFVLIELKSGVLPRGAEVVILPPEQWPPSKAVPTSLTGVTGATSAPAEGAYVTLGGEAHPGAEPSPTEATPSLVYIRLDENDDPGLQGRLPARFWSIPVMVRESDGKEARIARESDAVFIAVHVYDENAAKIQCAGTLAPEAYLRAGLFAACEAALAAREEPAADRSALGDSVADILPSLYGLGQVIYDTPTLARVIRPIVPSPSLWAILTYRGPDFAAEVSMADLLTEKRPLTALAGGRRAYLLPLNIDIKGEPAIQCLLSITPPAPPYHLCAGVVGVDGVQVRDASRKFILRLLAARRATK